MEKRFKAPSPMSELPCDRAGSLIHRSGTTVRVPVGRLNKDDTITVSVSAVSVHASTPLPKEIEQRDPQYLVWTTNSTYVDSWYHSDVERIKIRYVVSQQSELTQ